MIGYTLHSSVDVSEMGRFKDQTTDCDEETTENQVVEMPVAHHTGVAQYGSGWWVNMEYESENYH